MNRAGKWAIGAVLTAATAFAAYQSVSAPPPTVETEPPTTAEAPASETEAAPDTSLPTEPCGYQWAYQDDPGLTEELDTAVKALNPSASARVQAFGENCVRADGASTFGAMETDFYIRLPVEDLSNEEQFGNWVKQVLDIVTQIPRDKLQGPNYGFVEFTFEKSEAEQIIFRAPIQQYLNEAQGKSGAELFNLFYKP
jgi:hypothetical protein